MGGGLLDSTLIKRILDFLLVTVQQQRWQEIIEDVPKEYVKALFYLHCIRCKTFSP